jgi:hypothetical protein
MTKYYYRPIKDIVLDTYKKHAMRDLDAPENFEKSSVLIIEADNEEDATKIRIGFTDIRMWELFKTE